MLAFIIIFIVGYLLSRLSYLIMLFFNINVVIIKRSTYLIFEISSYKLVDHLLNNEKYKYAIGYSINDKLFECKDMYSSHKSNHKTYPNALLLSSSLSKWAILGPEQKRSNRGTRTKENQVSSTFVLAIPSICCMYVCILKQVVESVRFFDTLFDIVWMY